MGLSGDNPKAMLKIKTHNTKPFLMLQNFRRALLFASQSYKMYNCAANHCYHTFYSFVFSDACSFICYDTSTWRQQSETFRSSCQAATVWL